MDREPDFIGNFMLPNDTEQQRVREIGAGISKREYEELSMSGVGIFFMTIDVRQKEGELEKIMGTIVDNCGEIPSTFEGELSSETITFTKRYPRELVDEGFSVDEIPYEGRKDRNLRFKGIYQMKASSGNPVEWRGQFTLEKYFNPELN